MGERSKYEDVYIIQENGEPVRLEEIVRSPEMKILENCISNLRKEVFQPWLDFMWEFTCSLHSILPEVNPRIKHLALHTKKRRTRVKNQRRIIREILKRR